jgi:hypothetical protein
VLFLQGRNITAHPIGHITELESHFGCASRLLSCSNRRRIALSLEISLLSNQVVELEIMSDAPPINCWKDDDYEVLSRWCLISQHQ